MTPASAPFASGPARAGRPVTIAGLALLCYLGFSLLLPLVPPLPVPLLALLVIPSTALFMLLQLWLTHTIVGLRLRPLPSGLLALLFAAFWFATLFFIYPHRAWDGSANALMFVLRPLLLSLTITLGCAFFGILLSRIIREPNVLLPVALVAMPIDYLGAMTSIGFTNNAVAQNPKLVQALSVQVPAVGSGAHHGAIHPIAYIGPGDALFMAFFFAVVLRLNLNVRGTFWWMYGLLTLTMLGVLFTDINIAALIPMGLAALIANARYFKLRREEVFATLYAAALILVLVTGFYLYSHSHFYKSDAKSDSKSDSKGVSDADPNTRRTVPAPGGPAGNR